MNNSESSSHGVVIDIIRRVILIEDDNSNRDNSTLVYNAVPEGVNIFAMLSLDQPEDVTNLSNWRVALSSENPLFHNLTHVLQIIRTAQWHSKLPDSAYNLLLGLYFPVMILGTTLNSILLWTMLTTRKLRIDPRNSFILALACSDFFLCNFTSPLTLWSTLEGHWPLGSNTEILCKFVKAGQDFPIIMSSFCIGAIACDRFRYIVQSHKTQMTAKQGFLWSLALAVAGACFVSPVFFKACLKSPSYLDNFYCEVDWPKENRYHYTIITTAAHYFLTLVIVIVLYTSIYLRLKSRPPSQHEEVNRRRTRTNILLASITIVFFICWAPMVIFCLIYDFAPHWLPERAVMASFAYTLSLLAGVLTPIANPILYSLLNESFRGILVQKCWPKCLPRKSNNHATQDRNNLTEMPSQNNNPCSSLMPLSPTILAPCSEKAPIAIEREIVTKRRVKICAGKVKYLVPNEESISSPENGQAIQQSFEEKTLLETAF